MAATTTTFSNIRTVGCVPARCVVQKKARGKQGEEVVQKYQPLSRNLVDYVLTRSRGCGRLEYQHIEESFGAKHMLATRMLKKRPIPLNGMDTVFCSQWVSDHQIAMGTECNKLAIYDVNTRQVDVIPSLRGLDARGPRQQQQQQQRGIHSIEINPSRTLLATGALNNSNIAAYRLPALEPVCVGSSHKDHIFDMCWLNDQFLLSGSRDTHLALWKIDDDDDSEGTGEPGGLPNYHQIRPVRVEKCGAEEVRVVIFNPRFSEVVALSPNAHLHIWDANRFVQKMSRGLPNSMETLCLTRKEDCSMYAVGSRTHTALLDPRTLRHVRLVDGCSVRSLAFHGEILSIGMGVGLTMFFDVRAGKYMSGSLIADGVDYTAVIYTHCWSGSTRLFTAGGPLIERFNKGNYAVLWC